MLRNHSHYSLLLSSQKPEDIVSRHKELGYSHVGICDFATISGVVSFVKECKSQNIIPVIGVEIPLKNDSTISLFCKNINAWKQLLNVISRANDEDNFSEFPRIDFAELITIINPDDFVCIDGYLGSFFFREIFEDLNPLFSECDESCVLSCVKENVSSIIESHLNKMKAIFKNYYLELSDSDCTSFPLLKVLSSLIPQENEKLIPPEHVIPFHESYYCKKSGAMDHRVLLCSKTKTTMRRLPEKIIELKSIELLKFIRSSSYYIKQVDAAEFTPVLCDIEEFNILSNPKLPKFTCPNNEKEIDYLRELCRHGWRKLINTKVPKEKHELYKNRVLYELSVIEEANLSGYFLIVQDYVNHFKRLGNLLGPGRGSAAGSLVCYLTGITSVDPIEYGLIFERFYNKGRNTKDHVSLPDIDIDFPPSIREDVVEYLKNKYGKSRVCQIMTFGRLQGKSILKEVLRVNESCSFDQMNKITKDIPNDAEISDQLENMENPSILMWSLENISRQLADYCWLEDGVLKGEFSKEFEQAIRLEGVFKSQGKHAAGVVISLDPLSETCPMIRPSRGSDKIAGMEMGDLESIGVPKFDILGVSLLEKTQKCWDEEGDFE